MPFIIAVIIAIVSAAIIVLTMVDAGHMDKRTNHYVRASVVAAGGLSFWSFTQTCGIALQPENADNFNAVICATLAAVFLYAHNKIRA